MKPSSSTPDQQVLGQCFGIRIITRPECPNDAVLLMVEDDGNWFPKGDPFDAGWIDDLVAQLIAAKKIAKVRFTP
jgi:hypothetical protein